MNDKKDSELHVTEDSCSEDGSRRFWAGVGMVALAITFICIVTHNGNSAIAASIVFATSIYGYEHNT